jgi:hypothetical protein
MEAISILNKMPRECHRKEYKESETDTKLRELCIETIERATQDADYIKARNRYLNRAEDLTNKEVGYFDVSSNGNRWGITYLKNMDVLYDRRD